jgi:transcriptional regulator with XRE-family HTH domain
MSRRRWTTLDLAHLLGVSMTTASRLRNGARKWSLDLAGVAAQALNIKLPDLATSDDEAAV